MHLNVAGCAVADARIAKVMEGWGRAAGSSSRSETIGVAFQTLQMDFGPREHAGIGRAVRLMAGPAAFLAYGRMLKNKRPAEAAVAIEAAGFVRGNGRQMIRQCTAVWVMATRAFDAALLETVPVRALELSNRCGVARAAILRGGCWFGCMHRMAGGTVHVAASVAAAYAAQLGLLILMTAKACLVAGKAGKSGRIGNVGRLAGIGMFFGAGVARLAGLLHARVAILDERRHEVLVTNGACAGNI